MALSPLVRERLYIRRIDDRHAYYYRRLHRKQHREKDMFQNNLEEQAQTSAVHSSLTKSELIEYNLGEIMIMKGLRTRGIVNVRIK